MAETMRATVADYGDVLRARDAYAGGMQWLTAKNHQYLTRYRQDPLTGEKKATSLGRRTPENEAIYDAFMKERAELDERIAVLRPVMAEQARMARALRLTRAPSEVGAVLRAIGTSDLLDRLTLAGDACVFAYENEMGSLLSRDVLPDDGLDLVVDDMRAADRIEELAAVLRRAKIPVRPGRGRGHDLAVLRTEENLKIHLFTLSSLERMVDGYESSFAADVPRWALEQPPVRSVVIDRTGRAATVSVLDPRAWCILRSVALEMEEMSPNAREMATDLVSATATMVHEKTPFEEEQVCGFRPLLDALEGEEFLPPPRL
ncbi:GSU2403 family nucleotidyltransferase fold protein [Bradyrhizobium sp.]|uniref:GSU2403 family nucleotidyltransferase fold protein n=1 Tax=Bradyrhizobium sp. TaxID=376 RepID=UPI002724285E|nr:GSU2403 family nucleotidyltransferase fold protein [Bradyrhizobium sp.]MDO9294356.1 GSU2403 family nucleotidyltransferase fold protein [Bradyrhizobium sp.]